MCERGGVGLGTERKGRKEGQRKRNCVLYTCVCMYTCRCMWPYGHMRRPEEDMGCFPLSHSVGNLETMSLNLEHTGSFI